MKYTNEHNIPQAIVDAVEHDPYDKGDADFSVTELIGPPQIRHLWRKHYDDIEVDVSDEVWKLLGSGVHNILESATTSGQTENRYFADITTERGTFRVSGAVDHSDDGEVTDYKVSSVYAVRDEVKAEWVAQVNSYGYLLRDNGVRVAKLKIVVILRDWMKSRAKRDENYPQSPIVTLVVPLWPKAMQLQYLVSRINVHTDPVPAPCTFEERWGRGKWTITFTDGQKGRKTKVCKSMAEVNQVLSTREGTVAIGEQTYVRCEDWCAVARFCPQFNNTDAKDARQQ